MCGLLEGELWFHRWHMWPSSIPSVAAPSNSFVFIDSNSFSKDGRKINVGDCALFKPPFNSLPFVGRIRKLKLGKDNNISLCVNWIYRPADVKLKEGASLKAAPNEVFYSFHKDEIPAASLLHPCKVTFLRKGVDLPSGISSFVCRQVYDVENECLYWLTDRNYINGLQEEVDQLLGQTLIEMHPNGSAQRNPSLDNVQNSSSSVSSHAKSKKREHGFRNSESVKRYRLSKVDDADSGQLRPEHRLKTEIAKITNKGGLVDFSGVEKLIQLMQPEKRQLNLTCRTMLVDVISGTERLDCLGQFAHLKGLLILDEWLQEIHKGKIGDGSVKEKEKYVEKFLFSLLRALDRLPVNLHALQTSNVGKSVNYLRSHKNSEIQKKARSLVSTWKIRVEAEMNIIETKSSGSWSHKPMISEVSPMVGTRRRGGVSSHVGPKRSTSQSFVLKVTQPKQSSGEAIATSPTSPRSTKLSDKESPTKFATERVSDVSLAKKRSIPRLIVKFPNMGRSLTKTASLASPEDSSTISMKQDKKVSGKVDSLQGNTGDDLSIGKGPIVRDDEHDKKDAPSGVTPKAGKLNENSFSSMNALVERCAKLSEACASPSNGDDGGINLLASVAAGEMSRSDVSPACSPDSRSPLHEDVCSVNADKLGQVAHDGGHSEDATNLKPNSRGPLEENKCPDDIPVRTPVGPLDVVASCVKPETTHFNEDPTSCSSSDVHNDEKELVPKSEETDDEKCHLNMDSGTSVSELAYENTENDDKASVVTMQEVKEANCVEERRVKLDFDLNEVLPADDELQCEVEKAAVIEPNPLTSNDDTQSGLITVAAAAKGPFYPSDSLTGGKPEIGSKSSASTSVFHPAEPRKVDVPVPDTCTGKTTHALFDFDLNVGVEDANQLDGSSGVDLDLNACEESSEAVHLSVSTSSRPGPARSALPGGLNSSLDFDLNGPGMEETDGESVAFSKNGMQFISGVPNVRMNNVDIGNFSTCFPPNNAYPATTIPSQRMLTPVTSITSLKGPVLSSSPAVAFPSFQYPTFPFGTAGGPLCLPTIPSVGPNGVVSMPYYMGLPGSSGNVGPDGRKWGSQGSALNAGHGDDKLATAFRQLSVGGGDGLKRKEPDGGWDGDNRISYKHQHRQ